jgi:hypothetical protein
MRRKAISSSYVGTRPTRFTTRGILLPEKPEKPEVPPEVEVFLLFL